MIDPERTNTLTLSLLGGAMAYHRWIFEKIKPYLRGDILEVGCGIGNLTGLLMSQGKVTVADVNEGYLQIVEEKYRDHLNLKGILAWDLGQAPPQNLNRSSETIVCSNVLEHVEDDRAVLKNFCHLLPAGGRLIVLVPALRVLYNTLDRELGHFRRYNRKELTQKLTGNGFRICYLRYFNLFGILGWFVNGTILRKHLLLARQIGIFDKMVPLLIWIERVIPTLVGQSLIAVGEKDPRANWT